MDTKIISLLVHKDFTNDQFDIFISKNDIDINQNIIHFGVLSYSHFLEYAKNKHHDDFNAYTKNIKDELQLQYNLKLEQKNEENIILNNDCKKFKDQIQELQNSIHSLKDDKFFEINSLIDKGKQITKEEYQTIFDLQTQKNKKLEDDLQNTYQQIQELNKQLMQLKDDKSSEINLLIDKGKQISKEEYQIIFDLQNEKNKKLEDDLQNTYQQIQELNKQLIEANHNKYFEIEKEKQIAEERNQSIINIQHERTKNLEDNLKELHQQIQDLNNKLIEANKVDNQKNIQIVDNSINQLNNKFSTYFDKIFKGNTEKGEYGESFVNNYLSDKFNSSTIIDTHKEFAKGDFIFYLNQMKTLIEVKNVQKIKTEDIDKFYRDIQLQIQNDSINSAILVSLNDSNLIQGKRNFVFEIKYNIPIIMISNVFNNSEYIKFAIMVIDYLIINNYIYTKKDETKEEENHKIQSIIYAINLIFQHIQIQKTYLQEELNIIQKLTENYKKRENNLFDIEIIIKNTFMNFPQIIQTQQQKQKKQQHINITNSEDSNNTINDSMNTIIQIIKDNQLQIKDINKKKLNSIQINDHLIKQSGGIKQIIHQYNLQK